MSFKRLETEDLLISSEGTSTSCWTGNVPVLNTIYTSSLETLSTAGKYYWNFYDITPAIGGSGLEEVQFSVAYADKTGSGSLLINPQIDGISPSSVIYGQYRTLILGDDNEDFVFGTGNNTYAAEYFLAITLERERFKEKTLPGSLELQFTGVTLVDNSNNVSTQRYTDAGRVFDLVDKATGNTPAGSGSYGWHLPDVGIILLNGAALEEKGFYFTRSSNTDVRNIEQFRSNFNSFKLRSQETLSSNYAFIRVRNNEFNYSTNPSIIDSTGKIVYDTLIDSPQAFITSVGLYNDNNELLAVAKLSRPLLKDFTKESLIRIKLDF